MIAYGKMEFLSFVAYGTTDDTNFFVEKTVYETECPFWIPEEKQLENQIDLRQHGSPI
jgi:hypothetical protein